jgi:hypothetical protein
MEVPSCLWENVPGPDKDLSPAAPDFVSFYLKTKQTWERVFKFHLEPSFLRK